VGHEREEPTRGVELPAQALRALDGFGDVRYDAVAPTAHAVAEDPKATGAARADGALGDDAHLAGALGDGSHLDHEPALRQVQLECGVVEVATLAPLPRSD